MTLATRTLLGALVLAMIAAAGSAQERTDPTDLRTELDRLRAESKALTERISTLEAEGRLDEVKATKRRLEILNEHLDRFSELRRLVDESRLDIEKQRSLLETLRPEVRALRSRLAAARERRPESGAWLGVSMSNAEGGARVASTIEKSPARAAGLRAGDVVIALGDRRIASTTALAEAVRSLRPGDPVVLTVKRGEETIEIALELGKRPAIAAPAAPTTPSVRYAVAPGAAEIAKQEARLVQARRQLAAATAQARAALTEGRFDAAAEISLEAQRLTDAVKAAEARLAQLRSRMEIARRAAPELIAPGIAQTPAVEKRLTALEKRLGSIEGRLERIEKLLEKLAR